LEQLYYNVRIRWFFAISLDYTTRIAGGFLFRTLRELNWLKPLFILSADRAQFSPRVCLPRDQRPASENKKPPPKAAFAVPAGDGPDGL
uniref:hypothetical protein n=1 Tax=Paenibacillus caui TaxID=2873927 RepID=UPI001CA9987B